MGCLIIVLIAVAVYYCSEAYCDTPPTTIAKPEDTELVERNDSHAIEKGSFWKNLGLSRLKKLEESKGPGSTSSEAIKRKSRFLGSLAFLAGLSFGRLASAASSTVKSIAKLPDASFSLNLGSSNTSPYFAAYYNPYSLLPYPFLYPAPFNFMPLTDHAKPQTVSHNDVTPQVISLFDNRRPISFAESNEEYVDEQKKSASGKSNHEDEVDDRTELQADADRNAEEKTVIRGCKEDQRKHEGSHKESVREHEDLYVNVNNSRQSLLQSIFDFLTGAPPTNQTVTVNPTMTTATENATMTMTTPPMNGNTTDNHNNFTEYPPFPGYYGGYPQNINHVDLTSGYQDHSQINYNVPYEHSANFYHDDKYSVYSSPHKPYFSGPDQTNEYLNPDYNRWYHSEYQPPYISGFKPVK